MIHEWRTYTLLPGKVPGYLEASQSIGRPVRGNAHGISLGTWVTEFGTLNQVWHLWGYDSLDERARLRAELGQNPRWAGEYLPVIRPMLVRQEIRIVHPVRDVTPPEHTGGIYELRMYRTQPGMAAKWAQNYTGIMPVREKYSRNVGLWTGDLPQPNEVLHMWNYPGVDARIKTRAAVAADPEWQQFLRDSMGMVTEMQAVLLLPTAFSTMR